MLLKQVGSQRTIPNTNILKVEKKTISQLYYEGYFNNFDFDWKSIYLLPRMIAVDTKLRVRFSVQNTKQYYFYE